MLPTGKKDGKDKGASNDKDKAHDASALNGEPLLGEEINRGNSITFLIFFFR